MIPCLTPPTGGGPWGGYHIYMGLLLSCTPPPLHIRPPHRIGSDRSILIIIRLFLDYPNKKLDNVFANEIMDTM